MGWPTDFGYNVLGPVIWSAAGYVISQYRLFKKSKKLYGLPIHTATEKDARVHGLLGEVRAQLGAMRVYVSKFHNGEEFADGAEIIKLSRTHEVVRQGGSYLSEMWTSILVSSLPDMMKLVLETGASFTNVDTIGYTKFRGLCAIGGVYSVSMVGIYASAKKPPIAVLGADFDVIDEPKNLNAIMTEYAVRIEPLIHLR